MATQTTSPRLARRLRWREDTLVAGQEPGWYLAGKRLEEGDKVDVYTKRASRSRWQLVLTVT